MSEESKALVPLRDSPAAKLVFPEVVFKVKLDMIGFGKVAFDLSIRGETRWFHYHNIQVTIGQTINVYDAQPQTGGPLGSWCEIEPFDLETPYEIR